MNAQSSLSPSCALRVRPPSVFCKFSYHLPLPHLPRVYATHPASQRSYCSSSVSRSYKSVGTANHPLHDCLQSQVNIDVHVGTMTAFPAIGGPPLLSNLSGVENSSVFHQLHSPKDHCQALGPSPSVKIYPAKISGYQESTAEPK